MGCGGGDTEEEILNGAEEGLQDTSETLEETRVEPQIGDTVCEGSDVFLIANGGVLVFMETCTDGLTCVAEAEGCACVPNCSPRHTCSHERTTCANQIHLPGESDPPARQTPFVYNRPGRRVPIVFRKPRVPIDHWDTQTDKKHPENAKYVVFFVIR